MAGGEETTRRAIKTADWGGGWDLMARMEGGRRGPAPRWKRSVRETSEGLSHPFPWGASHPGPQPHDQTPLHELNIQPRQQPLRQHPEFLPCDLLVRGWFKARICNHKFCAGQSPEEGENQILDCPSRHQDSTHAGKDAYTADYQDRLQCHPFLNQIFTFSNLHLLPLLLLL